MEKEFVPYEQALELKELGFDEPCMKMEYHHKNPHIDWHVPNELDCPIPLYQQAFRWFRESYVLKSSISYSMLDDTNWYFQFDKSGIEYGFKTYEEAELECLKQLIEIVKEKL